MEPMNSGSRLLLLGSCYLESMFQISVDTNSSSCQGKDHQDISAYTLVLILWPSTISMISTATCTTTKKERRNRSSSVNSGCSHSAVFDGCWSRIFSEFWTGVERYTHSPITYLHYYIGKAHSGLYLVFVQLGFSSGGLKE